MILVLDSSALITLARIGRLDLLHHVAGMVHYAKERRLIGALKPVLDEMVAAGFFLARGAL